MSYPKFVKTLAVNFGEDCTIKGELASNDGISLVHLERAVEESLAIGVAWEVLRHVYGEESAGPPRRVGRRIVFQAGTLAIYVLPVVEYGEISTLLIWDEPADAADAPLQLAPFRKPFVH